MKVMDSSGSSKRRVDEIGLGKNLAKAVVLGGAGNLGSKVAHILAKQSFGRIIIVDCDVVEPVNVGYQEYAKDDVGKSKADALRDHLLRMYPWVSVEIHGIYVLGPGDFIADEDASREQGRLLSKIFSGSDAVVATFDRGSPRITFTALAVIYGKPLVLVSAWSVRRRGGEYTHHGQIQAWRPGMPCPLCYTMYSLSPQQAGVYVAHPAISYTLAALAAFTVERMIYGGIDFMQLDSRIMEGGRLAVEYLGPDAVKARCPLCSCPERYKEALDRGGVVALAEALERDLRGWWGG